MQNRKLQILSTKILDEALLKKAGEHAIDITCLPFIETISIDNNDTAVKIKELSERSINAIFTSSKAVSAVASLLQQNPKWNIYCLFGATKNQVQQSFPEAVIHADAKDSATLAEEIMKSGLREIYFFCGDKRMDTIPEKLADTKIILHQHTVYMTQATPHKIKQQYDGILFFSPSAVESFLSINKIDKATTCYAVGNTTAGYLKKFTNNIIIANTASGDAMLNKVIENDKK